MRNWMWLGFLALATLTFSGACFAADSSNAHWVLVKQDSRLDFASIKKGNLGEVHHFEALKGGVDENGKVNVTIDLSSVQTYVDIRNERLKEFLFETAKFPVATITTIIEPDQFESLGIGQKAATST